MNKELDYSHSFEEALAAVKEGYQVWYEQAQPISFEVREKVCELFGCDNIDDFMGIIAKVEDPHLCE